MKRFAALALSFSLLTLFIFSPEAFAQGRNKRTSARSKGKACAKTLASCPDQGCGGANMDALLNRAKNRATAPPTSSVVAMSLDDIRNLTQPDTWQGNKNRDELKGAKGEGQGVSVMGYLWKAKREHGESCNCGLDKPGAAGELITDIHMVLVNNMDDAEATSVTAEITPRVRAKRPKPVTWTASRIRQLQGKFIRVTGYLMLDTEHLIHNPLVRATNWEVHPITKLEVCTLTQAQCEAGNGWKNVP